MSDLRELLHQAAPRPEAGPDLDAIRGRVVSRRRTRRLALSAAVVLLVLGVIGAAVVIDRIDRDPNVIVDQPETPEPPPLAEALAQIEVPGTPSDVALGAGAVWVAGHKESTNGGYLARLDPLTGSVQAVTDIAEPIGRVEVLGSIVWTFGACCGDRSAPAGVVAFDAATGNHLHARGHASLFTPAGIAPAADGEAWFSDPAGNRVVKLAVRPTGLEVIAEAQVGGRPTDMVATDDGLLWVRVGDEIVGLDSGTGAVVGRFTWTGPLLAASQGGMVWTSDGSRLVELLPGALSEGASVALGGARIPVAASTVAVDEGGIWVGGADGVFRFAAGDLEAVAPVPVATLPLDDGGAPTSLSTDGAAVWITVDGLYRWAP